MISFTSKERAPFSINVKLFGSLSESTSKYKEEENIDKIFNRFL